MNPISENKARGQVIKATRRLVAEGLVARTWGNISARIDDKYFIITPSGLGYDVMTEADLVKVAIADCSYEGGRKPSSEKGIHADAYALRPEINFVIHTHQHFATAVSAAGKDIEIAPAAAYGISSTKKLRKNVAQVYTKRKPASSTSNDSADAGESAQPGGDFYKSFLMVRHGAVCLGTSAEDAFAEATNLEKFCEKLYDEKTGGKTPEDKFGRPYLDDYAQMIGFEKKAPEGEDETAVGMVCAKNAAAIAYAPEAGPLGFFDVTLQHTIYKKKYSKLKNK